MSEPNAESESEVTKSAASKLFDIRLLIGGLFVVYGVLLTVDGFFTSDKERAKAAGLNMNLWLGIGMLVLGLLFLLWRMLNPIVIEPPADADADANGNANGNAKDGGRHAQH
jgi:hypothetical protein